MNTKRVDEIANAVLYEGYMLYPYRPSAIKNRQRWNFGVLYPRSYSELQAGSDRWFTQTQCLVEGSESTVVDIRVRFLHAVSRQIGKLPAPIAGSLLNEEIKYEPVETMACGNRILQTWQEASEREVVLPPICLADALAGAARHTFAYPCGKNVERVEDGAGSVAAIIVRTSEEVTGCVEIRAEKCNDRLYRLTVLVSNLASPQNSQTPSQKEIVLKSLLSAHVVLGVADGQFVSLTDPPKAYRKFAAECENHGTWPVLVGDECARDAMLSSPIILYDFPQIAPESAGNLFDGTEIDEILALRILTLTEDEKSEMRQGDDRAREILERTESIPADQFAKLHGTLRGMRAAAEDHQ